MIVFPWSIRWSTFGLVFLWYLEIPWGTLRYLEIPLALFFFAIHWDTFGFVCCVELPFVGPARISPSLLPAAAAVVAASPVFHKVARHFASLLPYCDGPKKQIVISHIKWCRMARNSFHPFCTSLKSLTWDLRVFIIINLFWLFIFNRNWLHRASPPVS